jgi:hypothetical protein
MKPWLHLALWGGLFLGACSSGGPGGLTQFTSQRESAGDTFEGPNGGGNNTIETGQTPTPNNPQIGDRDATVVITTDSGGRLDANIPDVTSVLDATKIDSGGGLDAGGATCADLQTCCDNFTSDAGVASCQAVVDNGVDSTCATALSSYQNNGLCP